MCLSVCYYDYTPDVDILFIRSESVLASCTTSRPMIGRDVVQLARTYLAFGTHVVCMLGIGADATVSY